MISVWRSFLIERAASWNLPQDGHWRFLFHNNYHPHVSYIHLLWFHGNETEPRVVAKICREPRVLAREFENMQQVYPEIPSLMPQPLHFGKQADFWVLWMEGVRGSRLSLDTVYSPSVLRSVVQMVLKFHVGVRRPTSKYGADRHRRLVEEPLEALSGFGSAPAVIGGCKDIAREASPSWVGTLPAIPQHGDFCLGNLVSDSRGTRILDWEVFGLIDLPCFDLFTFLLSPLLTSGPVADLWPDKVKAQIPQIIDSYAGSVVLSATDLRLLFPLALANWLHVQLLNDGNRGFAEKLYRIINLCFENRGLWEYAIPPGNRTIHGVDLNSGIASRLR
ncbi:MAG: phosphotransferase [Bryobacteraceae bacterium]